jgi:hypothetical protein
LSAPRRLPHVLTPADLASLLAPTYAKASGVDEELAREGLERALASPEPLLGDLYEAVGRALDERLGPRQTTDAQLDRMNKNIPKRLRRPKAAAESAGVSAVLVRVDLAIGAASDRMQAMLESEKGRALAAQGLRELGAHLVDELLR